MSDTSKEAWIVDACTMFDDYARSLGCSRHVYSDNLRALAAKLTEVEAGLEATLQRERDANKRGMEHLRRAEKAEIASKNHASFSHEWRTRAEVAEAAVSTARRDALKEAAEKLRIMGDMGGMEIVRALIGDDTEEGEG